MGLESGSGQGGTAKFRRRTAKAWSVVVADGKAQERNWNRERKPSITFSFAVAVMRRVAFACS